MARGSFTGQDWPATEHDFDFEFIGLLGLADPVRAEVPAAVAECRAAGIRVVMITGDYPATARAIAHQAGLAGRDGEVLSGDEMDTLHDEALREHMGSVSVCARIAPEQKLRIVQALKARGDIVAMTGDGVNDAPALRAAHVGVAMGGPRHRRGPRVGGATLWLAALYLPWAVGVLRFAPLPVHELAAACGLGLLSVGWFEGVKWVRRRPC